MKTEEIIKKIALSPECGGEYCKEGIECEECIDSLIAAIKAEEREKAIKEFAEWLPQNFDLRFSNNPNVWVDEFFNHTSERIKEQLKENWNKSN